MLIIDVDDFKNYNDRYGHEKGDEALISIGRLLMRLTKRGSDYVSRLAGKEFAVIFSGQDPKESLEFSEKIHSEIERLRIEHIGKKNRTFYECVIGVGCYSSNW